MLHIVDGGITGHVTRAVERRTRFTSHRRQRAVDVSVHGERKVGCQDLGKSKAHITIPSGEERERVCGLRQIKAEPSRLAKSQWHGTPSTCRGRWSKWRDLAIKPTAGHHPMGTVDVARSGAHHRIKWFAAEATVWTTGNWRVAPVHPGQSSVARGRPKNCLEDFRRCGIRIRRKHRIGVHGFEEHGHGSGHHRH